MKKLIFNEQRGFTIIEVVLVLAIAGLIFLTVFLALPALQKSQRDNARKSDVGKIVAALQSYVADNNLLPAANNYSTGYFSDLAQVDYVWVLDTTRTCNDPTLDTIARATVGKGCKCSDTSGLVQGSAKKGYVRVILESGASYCKDM
mgnify:CR=1 FL=1